MKYLFLTAPLTQHAYFRCIIACFKDMPLPPTANIAERIRSRLGKLTSAERKIADVILQNYPISGLDGVAAIAAAAGVSIPTVARMGRKIGFDSYQSMQSALRKELQATLTTPIAKHDHWAADAPGTHMLNRFAAASIKNMKQTLRLLSLEQFNAVVALLADQKRPVHIAGGRLTRALADYFFTHLQVIRNRVTLFSPATNTWPHYVLNIQKGDVVIVFDIRRYEYETLRLAEMAKERGAVLVLFTDQWGSPVVKHAAHNFYCYIEVPSAWDSSVASLLIVESLIAAVENATWKQTRRRIKALESLYDRTGMFKKFS